MKIQSGVEDIFSTYKSQETKAHTDDSTLSFHVWVLTAFLFKKSIAISTQQEKKNTPGLYTDKSSIIEPLYFPEFHFKRV